MTFEDNLFGGHSAIPQGNSPNCPTKLAHGQADVGDLAIEVPAGGLNLDAHNLERGEFALAEFVLNGRPDTATHLIAMRDGVARVVLDVEAAPPLMLGAKRVFIDHAQDH